MVFAGALPLPFIPGVGSLTCSVNILALAERSDVTTAAANEKAANRR